MEEVQTSSQQEAEFQKVLDGIRKNSLYSVRLQKRRLREREVQQLVEALEGNTSVKQLDLTSCTIGASEVKTLAGVLPSTSVKELNLSQCDIGDTGAEALASVLASSSVQALDVSSCGLGASGAEALARALAGSPLQELTLWGNPIQDAGAKALAAGLKGSRVVDLFLSGNEIGDEGAKALASSLRHSTLTWLTLSDNQLGNEGVTALAAGIQESPLESLDLSENDLITGDSVTTLAAALKHSNIEWLHLRQTHVGDEAGQALLEGARDTAVTYMNLDGSGCSDQTCKQIDEVLQANKARCFLLQMQVEQGDELDFVLTFRTAAGTLAGVLNWECFSSAYRLLDGVFAAIKTSGFQLPDRHLRAGNLRIVMPDGQLLDCSRAWNLDEKLWDFVGQKRRRLQ